MHAGFYNVYDSLSSQTLTAVRSLLSAHPSSSLVVTGHSLGAAVATFAALDLKLAHPKTPLLFYAFGSPRPGNQQFSDFVNTLLPQYNRVVHINDVVPHLPLTAMGFNHGGQEIWYNTENTY